MMSSRQLVMCLTRAVAFCVQPVGQAQRFGEPRDPAPERKSDSRWEFVRGKKATWEP